MSDAETKELLRAAALVQSYTKNITALNEAIRQDRARMDELHIKNMSLQSTVNMQVAQLQQLQQQVSTLMALMMGKG
jgi:hypothetical protein